jgi:Flp pilus assembly protein TadD
MLNKINCGPARQRLIIYLALTVVTFAVFWQVNQFDFVNFDDHGYITQNSHIQSGITPDGIRWAFITKYFGLWNPLVWLSLMLDYHFFGLNAGGYHLTNLILHILSALLLFWLFNRMTGAIWKSAFVAAFFALHPLHVESVAWIAERKDVLSAFFWMMTLCLYVYYTEKPVIRRYIFVLFSFVLALMSKPMVVTLPFIMIFLDYWPLKRFESKKDNSFLWQLKEKMPFFILSVVLVIITLYTPDIPNIKGNSDLKQLPLISLLANSPVAFVTYLEKTFWPHDMAIFYPFSEHLSLWHIGGATLLIIVVSTSVILMAKRLPYLFVGWLWLAITIAPVIGIIQISLTTPYHMADRYHYLPSIGIAIILAWGIPSLIKNKDTRKKILLPATIAFLATMSFLTWKQCGYWKNSIALWNHALHVTMNNAIAHNNRGAVYAECGQYQLAIEDYNEVIQLQPHNFQAYYNRGNMYAKLNLYQRAIEDFNKAISLKPDYADAYNNRGWAYFKTDLYQQLAFKDFNEVIRLKQDNADAYNNRGGAYFILGHYQLAIEDFNKAIRLKQDYADAYNNRGGAYFKLGQYQLAIVDFNKAISLKPDYADAYNNRATVYLNQDNKEIGCYNAKIACALGNCKTLESAKCK